MSRSPYPLQWPAGRVRNKYPDPARTSVTLANARDHLVRQLTFIDARQWVITSNAKLKRDGFPYSKQPRTDDTGVALWFRLRGNDNQYCICCDQCEDISGNVRAIGLAIEELRGAAARLWIPLASFFAPFVVSATMQAPTPKPVKPKPAEVPIDSIPEPRPPKIPALGPYSVLGIPNTTPYEEVYATFRKLFSDAPDDQARETIKDAFNEIKRKRGFK